MPPTQTSFGPAPVWMTLLGRSEQGGRDYRPQIEGQLPAALRGSLFRNGPGLFERGGHRVQHLLDGDGLVQRLSFTDEGVRYQNDFVRTKKFVTEQQAGKPLHANWTTRRPGGFLRNLGGGGISSQAGITICPVYGKMIARDEIEESYEIDAETLETLQAHPVGNQLNLRSVGFKAHSKFDPHRGEWLLAGQQFGLTMTLHTVVYGPNFQVKEQHAFKVPRQVYIHDFFASEHYFVFVLHPCYFSPACFLAGFKSFTESCRWKSDDGNLIAVFPRTGGKPQFFEAPNAFMWHSLNAFESRDEIIADFVGYDEPDHFIGKQALFYTLMAGRLGRAHIPGTLRRYRINLQKRILKAELLDAGNHEFPIVNSAATMTRHRMGYFATGGLGAFNTGIKRLDYTTGNTACFDFGSETHVGEPVFVGKPNGHLDEGWLLAQCLDGASQKTFFAVFDAQTIEKGPIAKIWLTHPVPMSFHGAWKSPG